MDLESATDRFPIEIQKELISKMFSEEIADQ
jgi:hypothetical protein